ncbi:MAG: AAA family ATPase, partial [Planctomycetaceae bacterium]|nr:AAA family ATPase [Planctomycetaceae bacterium]
IHRDLKPANVMVDNNGHVIILDFGLVIEERPKADFTVLMTRHGFAGTPLYAAPEQMFGDCTAASDWYAVGVMLFEALTGSTPFDGSGAELMRAKSSTAAPELSGQSDVPADLAQLADDLLQRDPDERPDAEAILVRLSGSIDTGSQDSTDAPSNASGSASRLTLIGRDQELKTLQQRHRELQQNRQPQAVFIQGRSGEGKTALAEEFVRSVSSDYTSLILSGRCYDRESVPFKAIDAIIDSLVLFLRAQQDDDVRRWVSEDIGLLAHLFPILRRVTAIDEVTPLSRRTEDTRQFRNRAFAALRDLLTSISAKTPVVLFIDDLQWGDGDSATSLRDILQPPDAPAVMLLGTYRRDEADDSPFLKEWVEYKGMTDGELAQCTIQVHPLTAEQCLNLLVVRLGTSADSVREQAQQLFEGTRGNPYFLDQLLEGVNPETRTIEAVPLSELIERRLQRLPDAARALLKAIAVAGQAVALPEVAAVADESSLAMSTVTHMRNERLVRLIGSSVESPVDTYHDKIRETVLDGLDKSERRSLHARFGVLLEQLE